VTNDPEGPHGHPYDDNQTQHLEARRGKRPPSEVQLPEHDPQTSSSSYPLPIPYPHLSRSAMITYNNTAIMPSEQKKINDQSRAPESGRSYRVVDRWRKTRKVG